MGVRSQATGNTRIRSDAARWTKPDIFFNIAFHRTGINRTRAARALATRNLSQIRYILAIFLPPYRNRLV